VSEVIVAGAGLAGLVAAISCARAGHKVRVLERGKMIGGDPSVRPAIDVTPMDAEALGRFIGVELKEPQVIPTEEFVGYIYGKRYIIPGERLNLRSVERGTGKNSLDRHLYDLAVAEGVQFEFGASLDSQEDFAMLPPGSIVATGLAREPFRSLGRPFLDMSGFTCKGKLEKPPRVLAFFDRYTKYYCYCANQNGTAFGLGFDLGSVPQTLQEEWKQQLEEWEGWHMEEWLPHQGVVATPGIRSPNLFAGNKILAGTVAGMQDPFLLFGVHSSLCSGRIAAIAVDDRERAWRLFNDLMASYKVSWSIKKIFDALPHVARKPILRAIFELNDAYPRGMRPVVEFILKTIPGYGKLEW
jgi:flavin-dependent dehydrogenase